MLLLQERSEGQEEGVLRLPDKCHRRPSGRRHRVGVKVRDLEVPMHRGGAGLLPDVCRVEGRQQLLVSVFTRPQTPWLATMVMHYRHDHRSWDCQHGYISRVHGEETYQCQKAKVNNEAKRQIIRKCPDYLLAVGVEVDDFRALRSIDDQTIELATRKLTVVPLTSDLDLDGSPRLRSGGAVTHP